MLLIHNIKKIEGVAHKNGDIDGTCKPGLKLRTILHSFPLTLKRLKILLIKNGDFDSVNKA